MSYPERRNRLIFKQSGFRYYFEIIASNGNPLIESDFYHSKQSCWKGFRALAGMFGQDFHNCNPVAYFIITYEWEK